MSSLVTSVRAAVPRRSVHLQEIPLISLLGQREFQQAVLDDVRLAQRVEALNRIEPGAARPDDELT